MTINARICLAFKAFWQLSVVHFAFLLRLTVFTKNRRLPARSIRSPIVSFRWLWSVKEVSVCRLLWVNSDGLGWQWTVFDCLI